MVLILKKEEKIKFTAVFAMVDENGVENKRSFNILAKRVDHEGLQDILGLAEEIKEKGSSRGDKSRASFRCYEDEVRKILKNLIISWEHVKDEEGNILEYTPENLDLLCNIIPDSSLVILLEYRNQVSSLAKN